MRTKFLGVLLAASFLAANLIAAPLLAAESNSESPKQDYKLRYLPASELSFGYLVWVEKVGGSWVYKKASEFNGAFSLDGITETPHEEVLYFSSDRSHVQPYYANWTLNSMDFFDCSTSRDEETYSPCDSQFTKTQVGATVFLTLFGRRGDVVSQREIDKDVMLMAINEASVSEKLSNFVKDIEQKQYRKRFGMLSDSASIRLFLDNYAQNDPDNLIPKAKDMLGVALKKEDEQRKLDAQRAEVLRKQQALEAKRQQEAAIKREKEEQVAISSFRKKIQAGDESHCGLVVEVKKPLAQIQTPAGLNWMKIDQTFPTGLGKCPYEKPAPVAAKTEMTQQKYDGAGRKIIYGPVRERYLSNVHIISDSYGVIAMDGTTITDSVIEAPICVQSSGMGLTLKRNKLNCQLGVEFTGSMLMNNTFISNSYTGRLANRDF